MVASYHHLRTVRQWDHLHSNFLIQPCPRTKRHFLDIIARGVKAASTRIRIPLHRRTDWKAGRETRMLGNLTNQTLPNCCLEIVISSSPGERLQPQEDAWHRRVLAAYDECSLLLVLNRLPVETCHWKLTQSLIEKMPSTLSS